MLISRLKFQELVSSFLHVFMCINLVGVGSNYFYIMSTEEKQTTYALCVLFCLPHLSRVLLEFLMLFPDMSLIKHILDVISGRSGKGILEMYGN